MGTLSYTTFVSLDGYVADPGGDFQWSAPGDDVFRFHVDRLDSVSHEILGRKSYDLMRYWSAEPEDGAWSADEHEWARRWQGLGHTVVSSTLGPEDLESAQHRLLARLEMAELQRIVDDAAGEVEIFGPTTAAEAIRAGLVTDFRFFVVPMVVGGGLAALPADARLELELVENRTFESGTVYLHYHRR